MATPKDKLPAKWRRTSLARIAWFDQGASAVEFALLLPFLLVLACGLVELSNLFFVRSQLNEIVRDATRRLAVDAFSQEEARIFITEQLAKATSAQGEIDVTETSEPGTEAIDITVSLNVPLTDILFFDFVAESFGKPGEPAPELSVVVTMFKH
jgi:Flp pilus assembly protein TadG